MATMTKSKSKTTGKWDVKVNGLVVDTVVVEFNPQGGPESDQFRYTIYTDDDGGGTDDRDEVRQDVADMIRNIRNNAIESQRDRDNDQLDEAIESIKDAGRASKAMEVLRAAGMI